LREVVSEGVLFSDGTGDVTLVDIGVETGLTVGVSRAGDGVTEARTGLTEEEIGLTDVAT
jgi:hypothetical protein